MKIGHGGDADPSTRSAASSWDFNNDNTTRHKTTPANILRAVGMLSARSCVSRACGFPHSVEVRDQLFIMACSPAQWQLESRGINSTGQACVCCKLMVLSKTIALYIPAHLFFEHKPSGGHGRGAFQGRHPQQSQPGICNNVERQIPACEFGSVKETSFSRGSDGA
jgi:hypothetical protein